MSRTLSEALAWVRLTGWYPYRIRTSTMLDLCEVVDFLPTGSPDSTPGHQVRAGTSSPARSRTQARVDALEGLGFSVRLSGDSESRAQVTEWTHPLGHWATLTPGRDGLVTIIGCQDSGPSFVVVADIHIKAPHVVSLTLWSPYRRQDLTTGSPVSVIQSLMAGRWTVPDSPTLQTQDPSTLQAILDSRAALSTRGAPQAGHHITHPRRAISSALVLLVHLQGLGQPVVPTSLWLAGLCGVVQPTAHRWMKDASQMGMVIVSGATKPARGLPATVWAPSFPVVLVDGIPEPHWSGLERWEDAYRAGVDPQPSAFRSLIPRPSRRGMILHTFTPRDFLLRAQTAPHQVTESPITFLSTTFWWLSWEAEAQGRSINAPEVVATVVEWLSGHHLHPLQALLSWMDVAPFIDGQWESGHKTLMAALVVQWLADHYQSLDLWQTCQDLGLMAQLVDSLQDDPLRADSLPALLSDIQASLPSWPDTQPTSEVSITILASCGDCVKTGQSLVQTLLVKGLPTSLVPSLVRQMMASWETGSDQPTLREVHVCQTPGGGWRGSWTWGDLSGVESRWVFPLGAHITSPLTTPITVSHPSPDGGMTTARPFPGPYLST